MEKILKQIIKAKKEITYSQGALEELARMRPYLKNNVNIYYTRKLKLEQLIAKNSAFLLINKDIVVKAPVEQYLSDL